MNVCQIRLKHSKYIANMNNNKKKGNTMVS